MIWLVVRMSLMCAGRKTKPKNLEKNGQPNPASSKKKCGHIPASFGRLLCFSWYPLMASMSHPNIFVLLGFWALTVSSHAR